MLSHEAYNNACDFERRKPVASADLPGTTLKRTDVPEGQSYTTGAQGSALVDAGTYTLLIHAADIKTGISIAADTAPSGSLPVPHPNFSQTFVIIATG